MRGRRKLTASPQVPGDLGARVRLEDLADGLLEAGDVVQGELAGPVRIALGHRLEQLHVLGDVAADGGDLVQDQALDARGQDVVADQRGFQVRVGGGPVDQAVHRQVIAHQLPGLCGAQGQLREFHGGGGRLGPAAEPLTPSVRPAIFPVRAICIMLRIAQFTR